MSDTENPFHPRERGLTRALTILDRIEAAETTDRIAVMSAHASAIAAVEEALTGQARLLAEVLAISDAEIPGGMLLRLLPEEREDIESRLRGVLGFDPRYERALAARGADD